MRTKNKALIAVLAALCAILMIAVVLLTVTMDRDGTKTAVPFFNQTENTYKLNNDYAVSGGDNLSFRNGVSLDLGGNVLDLSRGTFLAMAGKTDAAVTIVNGTMTGGTPVFVSGQGVTLNNVRFDASMGALRTSGKLMLLNAKLGSAVIPPEDMVSYTGEAVLPSTSDVSIDAGSVVGSMVVSQQSTIRISGFVGYLFLTESAKYSYIEIAPNANVGHIYILAEDVFVYADEDAFVTSVTADEAIGDSVMAPRLYVEYACGASMTDMLSVLPTYHYVSSVPATCQERGNVVLSYETAEGETVRETFVTKAKHRYGEGKALTTDTDAWFPVTEYTCEYCGHVRRTLGSAGIDVDACDNWIDLFLQFVPDFNYDFTLDSGTQLGGLEVVGGYVHLLAKEGKLSGAVVADLLFGDEPTSVRAYIDGQDVFFLNFMEEDQPVTLNVSDFLKSLADTGLNRLIEMFDQPETEDLHAILTMLSGENEAGFNVVDVFDVIFDYAKKAYDSVGVLICSEKDLENVVKQIGEDAWAFAKKLLPVSFYENYLADISLFASETDADGNVTYTFDLTEVHNLLSELLDADVASLLDDYLYPAEPGEVTASDLVRNFLLDFPQYTLEEIVDATVMLAEENNIETGDLFAMMNKIAAIVLGDDAFDEMCRGDLRSLVDSEMGRQTVNELILTYTEVDIAGDILTEEAIDRVLHQTAAAFLEEKLEMTKTDILYYLTDEFIDQYVTFSYTMDAEDRLKSATLGVMQTATAAIDRTFGDGTWTDLVFTGTYRDETYRDEDEEVMTKTNGDVRLELCHEDDTVYVKELCGSFVQLDAVDELGTAYETATDISAVFHGETVERNGKKIYSVTDGNAVSPYFTVSLTGDVFTVSGTDAYHLTSLLLETPDLPTIGEIRLEYAAAKSETLDAMLHRADAECMGFALSWYQTDFATLCDFVQVSGTDVATYTDTAVPSEYVLNYATFSFGGSGATLTDYLSCGTAHQILTHRIDVCVAEGPLAEMPILLHATVRKEPTFKYGERVWKHDVKTRAFIQNAGFPGEELPVELTMNLREKDDGDTMLTRVADLLFTFGPDRAERNPDAESGYPVRMAAHYAEEESAGHRLLHTVSANVESRLMSVSLEEFFENSAAGTFVTIAYEETEYGERILPTVSLNVDETYKNDPENSVMYYMTPTDSTSFDNVEPYDESYFLVWGKVLVPLFPYDRTVFESVLSVTPDDAGLRFDVCVTNSDYFGRVVGTQTDWYLTQVKPVTVRFDSHALSLKICSPRELIHRFSSYYSGGIKIYMNQINDLSEEEWIEASIGTDGVWWKPAEWNRVSIRFNVLGIRYLLDVPVGTEYLFDLCADWIAPTDSAPALMTFSLSFPHADEYIYHYLTGIKLSNSSYSLVMQDEYGHYFYIDQFAEVKATLTDYKDLTVSMGIWEAITSLRQDKTYTFPGQARLVAEHEILHATISFDHGFTFKVHEDLFIFDENGRSSPLSFSYYSEKESFDATQKMQLLADMMNEDRIHGNDYLLSVTCEDNVFSLNVKFDRTLGAGIVPNADAAVDDSTLFADFLFTAAYDDDGVALTLSHHCPELITRISHNADTETRWGRLMSRLDAERGEICSVSFRKATETDGRVTYTANLHMNETGGDYDLTGQIWRDGDVYGLYANKMEDGVDMLLFAGDVLLSKDAFRLGNLHLTAVDSDTLGYHNVFDEFGVKYDLSWDRFGGAEAFKLKLVYDEISSEPILISFGVEDGAFHISAEAHLNSEMIPNAPDVVKIGFTFDTEAEEEMTTVEAVFDGMSREDFPPMAEETDDEDD